MLKNGVEDFLLGLEDFSRMLELDRANDGIHNVQTLQLYVMLSL